MKRIVLVAAIFAVAACSSGENAPATDTTTPALAPAPTDSAAVIDTTVKTDSTAGHSAHADSATTAPVTP